MTAEADTFTPKEWPGDYRVLGRVLDVLGAIALELHQLGRTQLVDTLMANLERHLSTEPHDSAGLGRAKSLSLSVRTLMAEDREDWERVADLARTELSIKGATASTVYLAALSLGKALQRLGRYSEAATAYVDALLRTGNVAHASETAGLFVALGWLVEMHPDTALEVSRPVEEWCELCFEEQVLIPFEPKALAGWLRGFAYSLWPEIRGGGLDQPIGTA